MIRSLLPTYPAFIGEPAFDGDPASIRTNPQYPRPLIETQRLIEVFTVLTYKM
jgi:hypothetical protein